MGTSPDPDSLATPGSNELGPTLPPSGAADAGGQAGGDELLASLGAGFAARYRTTQAIARGGMGQVVAATDLGLARQVAIKELLDPRHRASRLRFEREARLTARLEHPGIVAVHEFGRKPSGELYLVMRKVRGEPLSATIARAQNREERLALLPTLIAVTDAVAYAHQEGVVHRDLKPANVLIGPHGETLVVDWGLARDLRDTEPASPDAATPERGPPAGQGLTQAGSILGTPEYMAPEQARGEPADERSDVHALGVMLYQAFSGRLPYQGATILAVLIDIQNGKPPPLPTELPPELRAIIERAMRAKPGERYENAGALAADLRRFQTGRLVEAHQYSVLALLSRWVRRNAALVTVSAAALVALSVVGALSVRRVLQERDRANREAESARRVASFLTDVFDKADPATARGKEVTARTLLDRASASITSELADDPLVRAQLQLTMGIAYRSLGLGTQARPLLEAAVETRARLLGSDAPETTVARLELADATADQPEVERMARDVISRLGRQPDQGLLARALNLLGVALISQERDAEAERVLRQSLEIRAALYGPRSVQAAVAMTDLASAIGEQGRTGESRTLYRESLAILERELGPDSPTTLGVLQNVAGAEQELGEHAAALELEQKALSLALKVLGPDHPQTLNLRGNMAIDLLALGRAEEARRVLEECVASARASKETEALVSFLYNLACLSAQEGRTAEALAQLEEAVAAGMTAELAKNLRQDPDLDSLRSNPAFEALVQRAEKSRPGGD